MAKIKDPEAWYQTQYNVLRSLKQLLHLLKVSGTEHLEIGVIQELLILLETIEKNKLKESKEEKE